MAVAFAGSYFLPILQCGERVRVVEHDGLESSSWRIETLDREYVLANGIVKGHAQAAANAATRWLVSRAELTLKLAGRRAA